MSQQYAEEKGSFTIRLDMLQSLPIDGYVFKAAFPNITIKLYRQLIHSPFRGSLTSRKTLNRNKQHFYCEYLSQEINPHL